MTESSATPLIFRSDLKYAPDLKRGEFCYRRREDGSVKWVHFWPWDSPVALSASIAPQQNGSGAAWTLSGTETAPTLMPSVDAVGIWHGFLTNGVAKQ